MNTPSVPIAIIPARAGSKRVHRKNLLELDGVPLFVRAGQFLRSLDLFESIVVCSESEEVLSIAALHGFEPLARPLDLASDTASLDDLADWLTVICKQAPFLLYQPTVVGVTRADIEGLVNSRQEYSSWVRLVRARGHMAQNESDDSREEVSLDIGVRFYRINDRPVRHRPDSHFIRSEVVDIDTWGDMLAARDLVSRTGITFDIVAHKEVGYGHLYRSLALASELQRHDIQFTHHERLDAFAFDKINEAGWGWKDPSRPARQIVIFDRLDNTEQRVLAAQAMGSRVVTFEDLGPGAARADLVVNDLYGDATGPNVLAGSKYAILRPEFMGLPPAPKPPDNVLIVFGGTDAANLTGKVQDWIRPMPGVTVAGRLADGGEPVPSMAALMRQHKVVITSAGRTVLEAQAAGVPAIVIAANLRETTHTHLGWKYGNAYLGPHWEVTYEKLYPILTQILQDDTLRQEMAQRAQASIDGRGLSRVVAAIEDLIRGER